VPGDTIHGPRIMPLACCKTHSAALPGSPGPRLSLSVVLNVCLLPKLIFIQIALPVG
jgi:hypothetical protein